MKLDPRLIAANLPQACFRSGCVSPLILGFNGAVTRIIPFDGKRILENCNARYRLDFAVIFQRLWASVSWMPAD